MSLPRLVWFSIKDIEIDLDSQNDIPRILRMLQEIWVRPDFRDRILQVIQDQVGEGVRQDTGRPGMNYWRIFVLCLFKQALKIDFDWLTELANEHQSLRRMMQLDMLGC